MPIAQVSADDNDEGVDEVLESEGETESSETEGLKAIEGEETIETSEAADDNDEGVDEVLESEGETESSETEGLKAIEGEETIETSEAAVESTGLLEKHENGVVDRSEEVHPLPERASSRATGALSATDDDANEAGNPLAEKPELTPIKSGDVVVKESEKDVPSNAAEIGQNYVIGGGSSIKAEGSDWPNSAVGNPDSGESLVSPNQKPGVIENDVVSGSQFVADENFEAGLNPQDESTSPYLVTDDDANEAGNPLAEEPELKPIKSRDVLVKESENDVPSNDAKVGQDHVSGGGSSVEAQSSNSPSLKVGNHDSGASLVSPIQEPVEGYVIENAVDSGSQLVTHKNSEAELETVDESKSFDLVTLEAGNDVAGVGKLEGTLQKELNFCCVAENNDVIVDGGPDPIEPVFNDIGKTAEAASEKPRTGPAEVGNQTSYKLEVPSTFETSDQNVTVISNSTDAQALVSGDIEEQSVLVSPDDDERKDSFYLEKDDEIVNAEFSSNLQKKHLTDDTSADIHTASDSGETRDLEPPGKEDEITENTEFASNANDKIGVGKKPVGSHLPDSANSVVQSEEKADSDDGKDGIEIDEDVNIGDSETAELIRKDMEQGTTSSLGYSRELDGQIVTDSDEVDTDEEGDGKELFDSAALAALLKAASSANPGGSITITTPDGPGRIFSVERPAGLGSSIPTLRPAARPTRSNISNPSDLVVTGDDDSNVTEEEKKLQEKINQVRVEFLRLVQRLGQTPEETVAAQVLYRLNLAEGIRRGRHTNRAFSLESAKKTALQLESAGQDDLDFSFNVLILGKAGVGKSATINSIFGETKTPSSAFQPATTGVKEISGTVDGIQVRILDTPGLKSSVMDQGSNRKILSSIKKFTKKCPPDIVLYVDRLDAQTRDFNDIPLLRTISAVLGSSIWLNAIVALTHAASAPPDGPNGSPLSYDVFVAQRSHIVQHSIRQAAGDMRLMNPVALVENHASCRKIRGQSVLPNGQIWRAQLLLLCCSSKILSEANSLLKLQDSSAGKLFGFRIRSPPLPFLLSSLLQSRVHPKLSGDQGGENEDSDIDLADLSDSDEEEGEDEYDQLPPFKPLRKAQIAKLSKEQRKAYFDEYDFRVKLLQKKQWREELKRFKEIKKRGKDGQADYGYGEMGDDFDQENGAPAAVPVPLPDMVLPPSFDGDNPGYRYRFLEPTSGLLARPVLDTHGWDHDCGYDGVSLEESLAIASRFPAAVSVQITKDKKEFNIHLDSSVSAKHGEHGSSLAGFDIQTVGKQLAYILRGETKFKNFKRNKTVAGMSVTFLGENVATGLKIEDQISLGKCLGLVGGTGAVRSQGDVAYGANLEARLRQKDYPIGQDQSTLGLSLMRWRGDLSLGANFQSQFSIGRNSKMAVRVGLNHKLSGQITVRTSSSEQLQIALVGLLPIASTIFRTLWPGESPYVH